MKTVWKYNLPVKEFFELALPVGSVILKAASHYNAPVIWVLADPANTLETRKFIGVGTGHTLEYDNIKFIDTILLHDDFFVYHVFELIEEDVDLENGPTECFNCNHTFFPESKL